MAGKQGLLSYIKAIFYNPVHLTALVGITAAALFLLPIPFLDVSLPLIIAGEVTLLTAIASNPRFQRLIDSETFAQPEATQNPEEMNRRLGMVLRGLDQKSREQFELLRSRCEPLRTVQPPTVDGQATPDMQVVSNEQMTAVNRLLWVYLKLLYTRCTLSRFFKSVNEDDMKKLQADLRRRLEVLPPSPSDELTEKKRRSLEDTLQTANARVENFKRAKDNAEYVELELERIGTKLTAVAELAINRQDPNMITSEVDDVARSVETTEKAINDLQIFTGFSPEDNQAPQLIQTVRPPQQQIRA
jgi:hypothetical protein